MFPSVLTEIAEAYFQEVNEGPFKWNFSNFQYNGFIKPRKIKNARKRYAPYDLDKETPILIFDATILNNGKEGVFITDGAVYHKLLNVNGKGMAQNRVAWDDIEEILFAPKMTGSYLVINGIRIGQFAGFSPKGGGRRECDVINALFKLWTDAIK